MKLLIGIAGRDLNGALALLQEHCRTHKQVVNTMVPTFQGGYTLPVCNEMVVTVGGAKVFVVSVEDFVEV